MCLEREITEKLKNSPVIYHIRRRVRSLYRKTSSFIGEASEKNYRLCILSLTKSLTRIENTPLEIQLEITNRCNLKCIMCARTFDSRFSSTADFIGDMDMDLVKKIKSILRSASTVYTFGNGEPLLNPDFMNILRTISLFGPRISFNTNGTLLDEKKCRELVDLGVNCVVFSIDSPIKESFEEIRKGSKFDAIVHNIELLNRIKLIRRSKFPYIGFATVAMKQNISQLPPLMKLAKKLGVGSIHIEPLIWQNDPRYESFYRGHEILTNVGFPEVRKILNDIRDIAKRRGITVTSPYFDKLLDEKTNQNTLKERKDNLRPVCTRPWTTIFISWNGEVRTCCDSDFVFGNLRTQPIEDIWNGPGFQAYRRQLINGEIPSSCEKCLRNKRQENILQKISPVVFHMDSPLNKLARQPSVSIIILARNHLKHLNECLESAMNLKYPRLEVILADNDSTDGSPDFVQEKFPLVKVLRFGKNYGFAEGNNRAIRRANGDYIFLLNPDTKIEPECVNKLVGIMEQDESIGICMPKMLMFNEPSVLNSTGLIASTILQARDRGAGELDCGQYDKENQILGACGGAMLIRRKLVREIGHFDKKYFVYYEDLDFGIRAWLKGYKAIFVPEAIVYHKYRPFRKDIFNEYIDHRNRLRMMLKNMSSITLGWMLPKSLNSDIKSIYRYLRRKRLRLAYYRLKALIWNLVMLPDTLINRAKIQMQRVVKDKPIISMLEGMDRIIEAPLPNYDVRYETTVDRNSLDSTVKMGENDAGHLGFGWYGVETWLEKNIRWTTNYGIIFLKSPFLSGEEKNLEMEAYSHLYMEGTVWINGKRTGEFVIKPGGWQRLCIKFRSQQEVLKVIIKAERTFIPKFALKARDSRTLAIAVSKIGIAA